MPGTPETVAFDKAIRPVLKIVLPEKAATGHCIPCGARTPERIEALAEKSTEGELSEPERAEYEGYVRANKFVAILQRQARHLVASGS